MQEKQKGKYFSWDLLWRKNTKNPTQICMGFKIDNKNFTFILLDLQSL